MNKHFKHFLIFIIFFNCLFITIQDSFANFTAATVGPRDRIRNYDTGSTVNKSIIEYKYNTGSGFSCYPDNIKYFGANDNMTSSDIGNTIIAWSWDVIVNVFLAPFLCIATLKAASSSVSSGTATSLMGGLGLLLIAVATSGLERLEELIFAEDDYNLDPTNPSCMGVYISTMISCVIMAIVFKINIQLWIRAIIILSISSVIYGVKKGVGKSKYDDANAVFNRLSLCGDNWLTYGHNDLKTKLDDSKEFSSDKSISIDYIKSYFPTKGDFFGSYKYTLYNCFQKKNLATCKTLFTGETIENTDAIDGFLSTTRKQYREYLYDGMEYEYSSCTDPRTERKFYFGTSSKTSQLYYFRGNDAANFACDRFLASGTEEYTTAYKCCLEASQKLICISNKNRKSSSAVETYTMCSKDSSAGSCSLKSDYTTTSTGSTDDVCEDLKEQIESLSENENMTSANGVNMSEITTIYDTYCNEDGTMKDSAKNINNFSDTAISSQSTSVSGTGSKITFKISQSDNNENKYCVETYNLCPYNFRILGGSEESSTQFMPTYDTGYNVKEDSTTSTGYTEDTSTELQQLNSENNCVFDKDGVRRCDGPCFESGKVESCYNRPANFCQLDRHCVLIPDLIEKEQIVSVPYIDKACIDFVGTSHNFSEYTTSLNATNTKLFTAPFVECFVETFKNMLMNTAGHTRCISTGETADENNTCVGGSVYTKGEDLDENNYPSPFKTLKGYFYNIIKVLLVLFVVMYGFNMIILNAGFSATEVLKTILTIITISYFTLSNNWIPYVFNGIYTTMNTVSSFAMSISISDSSSISYDNNKYAGCYFFENDNIPNNYSNYGSRKYLAIFDTLDCKLSRYFGFSNETVSTPPILSYFISGLFSFGFTLIMILPFILVMMSLIFFAFRISYQFIVNSLVLTILLFLSPLIIPLYLFKKTKGFFTSWIKKIFSCIFGPIFTIMSLSVFLVIFDKYFVEDAVFYGTKEPIRDIYCGTICKVSDTNFYYISDEEGSTEYNTKVIECNNIIDAKVISLKETAPICASIFTNSVSNSGSSLFDFVIDGFAGFPAIYSSSGDFFSLFLSMVFLLLIIFIFEQFTDNISSMSSIFGGDNSGVGKDGIPTLQKVLSATVSVFTAMSNIGAKAGTSAAIAGYNQAGKLKDKIKDNKNNSIKRTAMEDKKAGDDSKVARYDKGKKDDNSSAKKDDDTGGKEDSSSEKDDDSGGKEDDSSEKEDDNKNE